MTKEDKRQKLIEAAYKVFSQKGFNNTSVKEVAQEAGITPGLVHYYFKSKEELLFAVQRDIQSKYHKHYDGEDTSTTEPLEVLKEIKSRVQNNPDWYRWRYELYSLGLKNESLQQEVQSMMKSGRDSLSYPLQSLVKEPKEADAMASILLACFDGLALQKMVADEFDIDASYDMLAKLFESYLKKQ
ncbi:TetR/AcrR family transcriptional regulator [Sutcliffiella sp. NC1]|uniref:TetR/AcrR family transcriptional regulator n=1 Tax=Sutcliffiella sp. NC1 TaxID=3004096 RepID=UPI0022DE55A2|nr:TetR/AcrR family transcriptional regulator [Sutcliffiella sp. NC1]WBL17082.1 TetR/AcrR family transcriptional regulator [Sutcliffiella sp. NC1]